MPVRPGPIVRLGDLTRTRDEVDDALDDVFGRPDDRGPGPVDAALLVAGVGAVVAGQATSLPTVVTVGGVIAVVLGAILPLRSLWRRVDSGRQSRLLHAAIGDGVVLRADDPRVEELLAAHQRALDTAARLAVAPRARVAAVAHAAVLEVASLLAGRAPALETEVEYVSARVRALHDLAAAAADPRSGDGERDRRQARADARVEVERLAGGSSIADAAALSRELLGTDGS